MFTKLKLMKGFCTCTKGGEGQLLQESVKTD